MPTPKDMQARTTNDKIALALFIVIAVAICSGFVSPPVALALGLGLALTLGNPAPDFTRKAAKKLLQWSVVGLGFGMNLAAVWEAGRTGFGFTVVTIFGTLALGWCLGRLLRVEAQTSLLVSTGTSICGGSAIAAVGGVIDADARAMSVALATFFVLNAVALFLFPPLGHLLGMDQQHFGVWSAIAIHDTSSVVGAAAIRTAFPAGAPVYDGIRHIAKLGLTLTLFFIGAGLTRSALATAGFRPMAQGILLWVVVSISGFAAVQLILP